LESHAAAHGLDNDENIPIPTGDLVAAIGFAIQGFGLLFLLMLRVSKKKP
jgi:hypothetical protein